MTLPDFPHRISMTVRYSDTDRQGHVNNAVFATMLEAGRVDLLYDPARGILGEGLEFVIVRLILDFRSELRWPGSVEIGTAVTTVGRSSIHLRQGLFQEDRCAAEAQTVSVLVDPAKGEATPFSDCARERLSRWQG